ncbi:MAG: hypothetical protein KDA38_11965 [Planctomycetales bacterium]|nr:hypothetical protein [Planctomycetales bacterium]
MSGTPPIRQRNHSVAWPEVEIVDEPNSTTEDDAAEIQFVGEVELSEVEQHEPATKESRDSASLPPVRLAKAEVSESIPEAVVTNVSATSPFQADGDADDLSPDSSAQPQARRAWPVRTFLAVASGIEWCFGVLSLVVGLAFLATFPILQLLSLGYLLEVSGRISRGGRLRDGFVGVRKAARVGSAVLGTWLLLAPLRIVSSFWYDAQQIDPGGLIARRWRFALLTLTVLLVAQIVWAWYRGGRLRHFVWPAPILFLRRLFGGFHYAESRDALWDFVVSLRLPYYFMLGAKGFCGAMAWLFIPLMLFIGSTRLNEGPAAALVGLFGAFLFATVLLYLPFLQAHFAAERRWNAMFEWWAVRQQFRRAPIAYWTALFITLLFAIPLYLLKIETIPEQVTWIPSLVFVVFIWPARMITGWAVARSRKREQPRHWVFRWTSRLAAVPVVAFYVMIVYLTQFISWNGAWNVFEQHAFLVPVPFLGL